MRAIVYDTVGSTDVLRCEEIDCPSIGDDELLIRVRAAAVNPLDWKTLNGGPYIVRKVMSWRKPMRKRCGVDVAGEVETIGRNVTQFKRR